MANLPNPLMAGFNPDPSIVLVDGVYYLVTSTFEYLPGLPVYRSTDLRHWEHIGNVAERHCQVGVDIAPPGGGVWAPTIRHRDGLFHVIVGLAGTDRNIVVFTASEPAGPWSDGVEISGIEGIDPDLAWDDNGDAYITYSALTLAGPDKGRHSGIMQARVDLQAGRALEQPRSLWSGTGLQFPEAPHIFKRDDRWYLIIAEGGTERGHSVSVARAASIQGPFEGAPCNPVLSAGGTERPVQATGHGDLVVGPDGTDLLVLLGVRPLGLNSAFSPLGRETFVTPVKWVDGWPHPAPVELNLGEDVYEHWDFTDRSTVNDAGWLGVRKMPSEVAAFAGTDGRLSIHGIAGGLASPNPAFIGRRPKHHVMTITAVVDATNGSGGLGVRCDESAFFALEARSTDAGNIVTATAAVTGIQQTWSTAMPAGDVELRITTALPPFEFSHEGWGGDRIRLSVAAQGEERQLCELDGRHWSSETASPFTGRVYGVFASDGLVSFGDLSYHGTDTVNL